MLNQSSSIHLCTCLYAFLSLCPLSPSVCLGKFILAQMQELKSCTWCSGSRSPADSSPTGGASHSIPFISPSLLLCLPSLHVLLTYPTVLGQQLCSASLSALTVLWNVTQDGKHLFILLLLCLDYATAVSGLTLSSCSINVLHFENESQFFSPSAADGLWIVLKCCVHPRQTGKVSEAKWRLILLDVILDTHTTNLSAKWKLKEREKIETEKIKWDIHWHENETPTHLFYISPLIYVNWGVENTLEIAANQDWVHARKIDFAQYFIFNILILIGKELV